MPDYMPQPGSISRISEMSDEMILAELYAEHITLGWNEARTFYHKRMLELGVVCTTLGIAIGSWGMYLWLMN